MNQDHTRSFHGGTLVLAALATVLIGGGAPATMGGTSACPGALTTTAAIQNAMLNATPGTTILIAPGTYVGRFSSGRSGTGASPIVLKSCDPTSPAVLSGSSVSDGSYGIHLTGDHWEIRDLVVTRYQKGIVVDNGNHNLLTGLEVHEIGDEGVHFRDGSSYNTLDRSTIHDTGQYQSWFGEGAYVGSDVNSNYEHTVFGNVIRQTVFAGGITAEHIDVKEGADGTIVEYCTFNGSGISGNNSADSFVDVKGVNTIVRYNQGSRNGNPAVVDAFQVRTHGTGYPTGRNNSFHGNRVDLDAISGYVVYATSATAGTTAHSDVRVGGGNLYSSNVSSPTTASRPITWGAVKRLYR